MSTRPHRTWTQRLVLSVNVLLVLGLLTAAMALVRYNDQVSQINRISGQGTLTGVTASDEPVNFLLVGVDNAEGLDPDDPVLRGRSEASLLSDIIMVVRVDPGANRAWLLSIPRDLWVTIAGTGTQGKINSALSLGGPQMLIDTLQTELDIPINHYVQVNFVGFRNLVEIIGGVPVWFEFPARDQNSGLAVESPGCVNLEGEQALAFVRSRYFEILVGDQWVADPTSDRGRIARQQAFVRAALNRAVNQGARNPFEMQRLITATQGEVVLDDSLSLNTLLGLGTRLRDFNVDTFEVVSLPTDDGWAGSASVAYLRDVEAQPLLAVFRGQTLFGTPNALVRVGVRNGSGASGQAAEVGRALEDEGFTVVDTGDAPGHSGPTVIRYAQGGLLQALLLSRYLGLGVTIEQAADGEIAGDTGLLLITGDNWTGLLAEPVDADAFQSALEQFSGAVATDAASGTATTIGGLTIDNLDDGPVSVPTFTATTVTPQRFVPTPPEGVECG